ncbi:hypothetical protein D3C76_1570900 [compost metagenome]
MYRVYGVAALLRLYRSALYCANAVLYASINKPTGLMTLIFGRPVRKSIAVMTYCSAARSITSGSRQPGKWRSNAA